MRFIVRHEILIRSNWLWIALCLTIPWYGQDISIQNSANYNYIFVDSLIWRNPIIVIQVNLHMIRNNNSWFNRIKSWALVVEDRSLHFWFWSVELWMPLWSFKTWRNYKLLNSNINNTVSLKQLNKNCIDQYIFETWFSIYSIIFSLQYGIYYLGSCDHYS